MVERLRTWVWVSVILYFGMTDINPFVCQNHYLRPCRIFYVSTWHPTQCHRGPRDTLYSKGRVKAYICVWNAHVLSYAHHPETAG